MPTLTKLYTMKEASQHNTKDDCWIVVDGKVYDVSTYLDDHPGGDDVILATVVKGKDATDYFEDAGHSKSAKELMETMCIGEFDTDVDNSASAEHEIQQTGYPEKLMTLTKQYWAVPTAVVGISLVVGILYMRKK